MTKIISDTSTLYSIAEGAKKNIAINPLNVTINGKTYLEFEEINSKEFLEIINQGHLPTSSQPFIGSVIDSYEKYKNEEIINITMADGLSGTFANATMAKDQVEGANIHVINSKTLCGPHRYMVDKAQEWADKGLCAKEIIERLQPIIDSSISFLIPQDFDYLKRGGRCSKAAASLGGLLKLVIVMGQSNDGKSLEKHAISRTYKKALASIANTFKENGVNENYIITISHATNEKQVNETVEFFQKEFNGTDIIVYDLSPAFITQGGPGCLAIQAVLKSND